MYVLNRTELMHTLRSKLIYIWDAHTTFTIQFTSHGEMIIRYKRDNLNIHTERVTNNWSSSHRHKTLCTLVTMKRPS